MGRPAYSIEDVRNVLLARREIDPSTGCWNWTGVISPNGYGRIKWCQKNHGVHRAAYLTLLGKPIPQGFSVLHKCDNKRCLNPSHLYIGTQKDNVADREERTRSYKGSGNPNARLNEDDLVQILRMGQLGLRHKDIAQIFGVSRATISQFLQGRTWRDFNRSRSVLK